MKNIGGGGLDLFWPAAPSRAPRSDSIPSAINSCAYFPSPRGCTTTSSLPFNFQLCVSVPLWQIPCSQQFAASLPLFALFSALPSFVFNRLQPLFAKHPGGGYPELQLPGQKTRGHAGACPLHNSSQLRVNYAPAPFEKLPTASASVLYTSKTVRSLVICRTS